MCWIHILVSSEQIGFENASEIVYCTDRRVRDEVAGESYRPKDRQVKRPDTASVEPETRYCE